MSNYYTLRARNNRYLSNLTKEQRDKLFTKLITKYQSEKYRDREARIGYIEARFTLYDVILEWACVNCPPSYYGVTEDLPEEQYLIDDKFVVGRIYGMGDFTYMQHVDVLKELYNL